MPRNQIRRRLMRKMKTVPGQVLMRHKILLQRRDPLSLIRRIFRQQIRRKTRAFGRMQQIRSRRIQEKPREKKIPERKKPCPGKKQDKAHQKKLPGMKRRILRDWENICRCLRGGYRRAGGCRGAGEGLFQGVKCAGTDQENP